MIKYNKINITSKAMRYILYILLIIIFFSCKEESKKEGIGVTYYKNGNVKSLVTYAKGKKEGKSISFNENGEIKEILSYKRDTLKGINYNFYDNGVLSSVVYINDTVINGPQLLYHPNGLLERYSYIDNNKQTYYQKYDSCGNMIKREGFLISDIKGYNTDTLWIKIVDPPGSENEVEIFEFNDKGKVKTLSGKNLYFIEYKKMDTSKGINISVKLKDLQTNEILESQVNFVK